ncbi:MAG: MoaD/ThiS family protein [Porticoccaceae bacterium]|jgi:molybdopterin synthase sulfur carrier subunit|nr:MoaD/ThiS family protein [Porticoccaceae bacterium]MEA3300181.1 MoaD/ThiS family protein [Pseudomonadota bacterium]HLS99813.1 MoaD/ThiS family protein [Porticoccaceae bacterium]
MLRILFFGRLGDIAGCESRDLPYDGAIATVAVLRDRLGAGNEALARALAEPQVMVAVNQQLVDWDCSLQQGDEIAFLPPVTGG